MGGQPLGFPPLKPLKPARLLMTHRGDHVLINDSRILLLVFGPQVGADRRLWAWNFIAGPFSRRADFLGD